MVNFTTDLLILKFCQLYLIHEILFGFGHTFGFSSGELTVQILLSHRLQGFFYYT